MQIEIIEPKLFSGVVADEIVASITDAINEKGRCSLVLAGGSTPSAIYRMMAKPPRVSEVPWPKVSLYWGDERWVSRQDNQSNYKMVQETLLTQIPGSGPRVFGVDTSLPTPAEGAKAYIDAVKKEEGISDETLPIFDVVLLGCGEDGHTASLFPHLPALEGKNPWCMAVRHPDGSDRVTFSPEVLLAARRICFIIKGEGKSDIVKRVLEGPMNVAETPAQLFRRVPEKVTWFLDSGSAQKLDKKK